MEKKILTDTTNTNFLTTFPLWLGTLQEIEMTLPKKPGMFNLIILDEASQISQTATAEALARAKTAMIAGDPNQLHHVSFTPTNNITQRLTRHNIPENLHGILNTRTNSISDVAARLETTWLNEHYRSRPTSSTTPTKHFTTTN